MAPRRANPKREPAWLPFDDYTKADVLAIRALQSGTANEVQQQRALDLIIRGLAGTYELSFRSDADGGDRDTAFAEGRRHVGLALVKMLHMPSTAVEALPDARERHDLR